MANELKVQNGLVVKGTTRITGSLSTTGGITGSLLGTASLATTATNALTLNGASAGAYATTGSNTFTGVQTFNNNVTINGTASIAYLSVAYESASIIYSSGSNQIGDATNDTQTIVGTARFSGSIESTGSLTFVSGFGVTGSLFGTASWASNALTANTASYVLQAVSASFATLAANSSQLNGQAASYYLNASNINAGTIGNAYLPSAINVTSVTASFKGDLVGTASWSNNTSNAANATNAVNASNVAVTDNPAGAGPYYITFVSSTSGNQAITVDSSTLTYDPSTNTITTTASYASQALTASYALNAKQLNGQNPSYYLDASNISAGTLSNAYLPSAINVTSVTASFKGNLTGTASYASQALSASFATTAATASTVTGTIASASMATSASFASTASFVNTLNQDVTIGSSNYLSIGANSKTFSAKQLNKSTATTILSVNTGTYTHKSIFVRYVLTTASGTTDMRAGTIMLVSDGNGNISIAEATTQDIGDTSMVNFTATASGGINEIVMTPSSGNWDVFFDYTLI